MATQNRHLTPKKTTLDEAIATDIAINIIAIQHLKFFLKKLSKNVATCLTLTEGMIGADIGTQTVAYTSDTEVGLKNLSERDNSIQTSERKERL